MLVWESADDTLIGGGPTQRNVISGNGTGGGFSGVGVFSEGATGNSVTGNWIGLAANGTSPVGNAAAGVVFNDTPNGAVESNVIAGNTLHGVLLFAATETEVDSNTIGRDTEGAAEGNGGAGVYLLAGGNIITPGNVISANAGGGIVVETGSGNQLQENQIDGNTGLGIDLFPLGVTANDGTGDPDTGPNDLQNFPVLTSATPGAGGTAIVGEILTGPTGDYRIDFYASATCDASGNGEGARWLGSSSVATNVDGFAAINTTASGAVTAGEAVTATATAPNGSTSRVLRVRHRRRRRPVGHVHGQLREQRHRRGLLRRDALLVERGDQRGECSSRAKHDPVRRRHRADHDPARAAAADHQRPDRARRDDAAWLLRPADRVRRRCQRRGECDGLLRLRRPDHDPRASCSAAGRAPGSC